VTSPIVVATTFREFRNNENDAIQWMFLWALKRCGVPIELAVTTFGEANVEKNVRTVFPEASIRQAAIPAPYRYSHSEVFETGLAVLERSKANAMLWTTCDVILSRSFVSLLSRLTSESLGLITSHPHTELKDEGGLHDYDIASGFDCLALTRDLALHPKVRTAIGNYRFYDWGIFEHFLIALGASIGAEGHNFSKRGRIIKLENNRVLTKESSAWMAAAWKANAAMLERFLSDEGLSRKYLSLFACHRYFSPARVNWFSPSSWKGYGMELGRRLQKAPTQL
jgi:hypothetical protein